MRMRERNEGAMDPGIAKHVGAGLLGEVEEESLEMLLATLQQQAALTTPITTTTDASSTTTPNNSTVIHPKLLPLPPGLRDIITRHQRATAPAQQPPVLSITGRYLPLLYHLISTLIAAPHRYAVLVVDPEWRFDATRLVAAASNPDPGTSPNPGSNRSSSYYPAAAPPDLRHVHVLRPPRAKSDDDGDLRAAIAGARERMLYAPAPGCTASRGRELWGTVVVGSPLSTSSVSTSTSTSNPAAASAGAGAGAGAGSHDDGVLVAAGWKGWLRVDREDVPGFAGAAAGLGSSSVEEALAWRERRAEAVERARWVAGCRWGGYAWRE